MAVVKLLNLLALSCLAIIASLGPAPVAAVSVDFHQPRHNLHSAIAAKKKRETSSKRCKPRPTSPPKSTKASSPAQPTQSSNSGSSGSGNGNNGGNSTSNNGSGAGKVGIAWNMGNNPAIKNFKTWKVDRYYTWSPWCVDNANAVGMRCCPMFWGPKQANDFTKLVKPGYADCVMGFNEPNQDGQANMSPQAGADLWRQYINHLKDQGYFLVSPACTNAPSGKTWYRGFFDSCKDCQIDAIGVHWYGIDADDLINYVTDIHNTFGKPIWVTEFACQDFATGKACPDATAFMQKVTSWMDQTSFVQEYFAFGVLQDMGNVNVVNQLISPGGQPNALGRLYIGLD